MMVDSKELYDFGFLYGDILPTKNASGFSFLRPIIMRTRLSGFEADRGILKAKQLED